MNTILHPCFDEAQSGYRIHLPVAKTCNLRCNFCKIQFNLHSNRPGVASGVLAIDNMVEYVNNMLHRHTECKILGISGPGDPLDNPKETFDAFKLINTHFPEFKKCMCTNGLMVSRYIDEIKSVGIDYITLTINSVDIQTLKKIYRYVILEGRYYTGEEGGKIIKRLQNEALEALRDVKNIKKKINIVLLPEININNIYNLLNFLSSYNIDIINLIPFIPVKGTPFGELQSLSDYEYSKIKDDCRNYFKELNFKNHCSRCRADAHGLIYSSCSRG